MRALVTGAASLVGARLCELLVEDDHEVIALDDFATGSWSNLAHLEHQQGFTFVEHDIAKAAPLELAALDLVDPASQGDARLRRFDAVFHLAVPSSRRHVARDPADAALTCVAGTKNALESARGARFVTATSLDAFGPGVRCAEELAVELGRDVRVVRVPTTFGPQMDPDEEHPVAALVLRALAGERLDAEAACADDVVRVAYVDDVAQTLVRAMQEESCGLRLVAPYHACALRELADMVADAASASCVPRPFAMPPAAPAEEDRCVDAALVLGLGPSFDLREAVALTMSWFEERTGRRTERTSGVYVRGAASRVAKRLDAPCLPAAPRSLRGARRA